MCEAITRGAHRVGKEFRASALGEPQAFTALPRLAVCQFILESFHVQPLYEYLSSLLYERSSDFILFLVMTPLSQSFMNIPFLGVEHPVRIIAQAIFITPNTIVNSLLDNQQLVKCICLQECFCIA